MEQERRDAVRAREVARRRIKRITGWGAAGAVALGGILTGLAAGAHPGRAANASHGTSAPAQPASTRQSTSPSQGDQGLQPPAAPPDQSAGGAGATSGGS
jgi:hypothetical protein